VGVNTTLDSTGQKDSDELEEEEDYQHDPNSAGVQEFKPKTDRFSVLGVSCRDR